MDYLKDRQCLSKKQSIRISGFIIMLIVIFHMDHVQQNRFDGLRNGYEYMESGKYQEAIQEFEAYLNVDSKVYWKFIDLMNEYPYTQEGVMEAARQCTQFHSE